METFIIELKKEIFVKRYLHILNTINGCSHIEAFNQAYEAAEYIDKGFSDKFKTS